MSESLRIQMNGEVRTIVGATSPTDLAKLVEILGLKADRIAVEHDGEIVPRKAWSSTQISAEDRLEIVHFVGGGKS